MCVLQVEVNKSVWLEGKKTHIWVEGKPMLSRAGGWRIAAAESDMLRNKMQMQKYNKRNILENSFGGEKRDY